MLNAISFYCFNTDITKKEFDELRKINNTYMKEKSPIAKETNSRKKHLEIKTKIYLSTTDKNLMKILTIGGERLYEIGFIRCGLDLSSGRLYIPFLRVINTDGVKNIGVFFYIQNNNYSHTTKGLIAVGFYFFSPNCTFCVQGILVGATKGAAIGAIGGELNPKFCFPIRRTCGKIFIQCLWKQHRNIWQFI